MQNKLKFSPRKLVRIESFLRSESWCVHVKFDFVHNNNQVFSHVPLIAVDTFSSWDFAINKREKSFREKKFALFVKTTRTRQHLALLPRDQQENKAINEISQRPQKTCRISSPVNDFIFFLTSRPWELYGSSQGISSLSSQHKQNTFQSATFSHLIAGAIISAVIFTTF